MSSHTNQNAPLGAGTPKRAQFNKNITKDTMFMVSTEPAEHGKWVLLHNETPQPASLLDSGILTGPIHYSSIDYWFFPDMEVDLDTIELIEPEYLPKCYCAALRGRETASAPPEENRPEQATILTVVDELIEAMRINAQVGLAVLERLVEAESKAKTSREKEATDAD